MISRANTPFVFASPYAYRNLYNKEIQKMCLQKNKLSVLVPNKTEIFYLCNQFEKWHAFRTQKNLIQNNTK